MPIERMKTEYLPEIVDLHRKSFQDFFLTFLGERFLCIYYSGLINYKSCVALVSIDNGLVKGFIVGVMNPSRFYSTLIKRDLLRFALATLPAILRRPLIIFRLARALKRPADSPNDDGMVELTSLAVRPSLQNTGVGKALVAAFIEEAITRGAIKIFLTTDANDNEQVNSFYQNMGFELQRSYTTPEKRLMNYYRLSL